MEIEGKKQIYIVLLQNSYLLFFEELPQKKGAYLSGVRLFHTSEDTNAFELSKWIQNKHKHSAIHELKEWV